MFLTKAASDIYCEDSSEKVRIKKMVNLAQVCELPSNITKLWGNPLAIVQNTSLLLIVSCNLVR